MNSLPPIDGKKPHSKKKYQYQLLVPDKEGEIKSRNDKNKDQ